MSVTPNAMPRKANPLRQQALADLIETVPVSWTRKRIDPKTDDVVKTKVTHQGLRYPLAQNVSQVNVERAAKGWIK
jgi:hypothetical protein